MAVPKEFLDALKAVLFPELDKIKTEIAGVKGVVSEQSQRIGDLNLHFIELEKKIEATNNRIDATNIRIDGLKDDFNRRIDEINARIDGLSADFIRRIDGVNDRLNRLYEVIVRREEHDKLDMRMLQLEVKVKDLSEKVAVLA